MGNALLPANGSPYVVTHATADGEWGCRLVVCRPRAAAEDKENAQDEQTQHTEDSSDQSTHVSQQMENAEALQSYVTSPHCSLRGS